MGLLAAAMIGGWEPLECLLETNDQRDSLRGDERLNLPDFHLNTLPAFTLRAFPAANAALHSLGLEAAERRSHSGLSSFAGISSAPAKLSARCSTRFCL